MGIMGEGWAWLAFNKQSGNLEIVTTANNDLLILNDEQIPLLTIDVWDHSTSDLARAKFMRDMWKIINWNKVGERLAAAKSEIPMNQIELGMIKL